MTHLLDGRLTPLLVRLRACQATCLLALCLFSIFVWLVSAPEPTSMGNTLDYQGPTDVDLYRSIAARVANGESYYFAAAAEHRAAQYPLYPFYTVRPPVLAWLGAGLCACSADC